MSPLDNNDTDVTMRELFAEPSIDIEQATDELFVARVMEQVTRRRRLRVAMSVAAAAAFAGVMLVTAPFVITSTSAVASLTLLATEPFQQLLLSPIGFAASLPIGIVLLALSSLRLTDSNA